MAETKDTKQTSLVGKVVSAKNNKTPTIKYCGLNISLKLLLKIDIKNIEPKGITNPGIPFAITANAEKI